MSAAGIRAGRAFVEMLIDDETVQTSLNQVHAKLRTFGAAVDATAGRSFVAMNATASTAMIATGASVGVLAATMGVLQASVFAVGNAFRVAFNLVTTSVTRAVLGVGSIAFAMSRLAPKGGKLAGLLDGFLSNSATTEALGRWTRFFGLLSGSSVIKGLGNRIERLGLGSAIVRGFATGGVIGGLSATLGASFRSAKSVVLSGVVGLFSGPIGVVRGMLGSVMGAVGGGGGLKSLAGSTRGITRGLASATAASRIFGATSAIFNKVATAARGLMLKFGGLAAAIVGPALLAAKKFVTAAVEITDEAKKTGKSLDELISKKYGENSLISRGDIAAGAALGAVMKELKQAMAAAWAQIGAAALPVLRGITDKMLWAAGAATQLLGRNRELVATVIRVAAQVGSAAAAGLALYAAFPLIAAGVGMILSPLGLIAAGVIAVAYAFAQLRTAIMGAVGPAITFLSSKFHNMAGIVGSTMTGIKNALSGGNLTVAARVLWAGINLLWLDGTTEMRAIWRDAVTSLNAAWINFSSAIQSGWAVAMSFVHQGIAGIKTAWGEVVSYFTTAWNVVSEAVGRMWTTITGHFDSGSTRIQDTWSATVEYIQETWATLSEAVGSAWKGTVEYIQAIWATLSEAVASAWKGTVEYLGTSLNDWIDLIPGLRDAWAATMTYFSEAWSAVVNSFVSTWRTAQNMVANGMASVIARISGQNVDEVLATLKEMQDAEGKVGDNGVKTELSERGKAAQKRLDEIEAERKARLAALGEEAVKRNEMAGKAEEDAFQNLLAAKSAAAELKPKKINKPEAAGLGAATSLGSFSAGALAQSGQSGFGKIEDFTRRTALATEKLANKPTPRAAFS